MSALQSTETRPEPETQAPVRRIGSMRGLQFIADGHDIDDYDDEIEVLFEAALRTLGLPDRPIPRQSPTA